MSTKSKPNSKPKAGESKQSYAAEPINKNLSADERLKLLTDMIRIRRFEERCIRSYQQGHIGGFCHTYIGQESVAIGTISVLGPEDHIISAYRIHGHALAIGMTMNELMAEMYGKVTGCSQGKGGSMHFMDPARHFWGGHGIVGAQTPLGAGIAFALKYQGKKGACLCYLGDGAVNQGAFYEALNLASLWSLPVIYIIENNRFSMGTSQARSSAGAPLAKRAEGFNVDWDEVDGNDLYEVRYKTALALQRAHESCRPSVLEIHTYRYRGHSMSDPDQTYRTKDDIHSYRDQYDPIMLFEKILEKEGVLDQKMLEEGIHDEKMLESIDAKAKEEAELSAQFAEESPFPPPSSILKHIYWEEDHPEHKVSEGTMIFNQLPEQEQVIKK